MPVAMMARDFTEDEMLLNSIFIVRVITGLDFPTVWNGTINRYKKLLEYAHKENK